MSGVPVPATLSRLESKWLFTPGSAARRTILIGLAQPFGDQRMLFGAAIGMGGSTTDSPLFWLLLFGSVGLVMLAAVEPKFVKRQERIERMQQSRQAGQRREAPAASHRSAPAAEKSVWQPQRRATLRPLALFLAAVLVAAMGLMHIRRRQVFAAVPKAPTVGEEGNSR